MVTLQRFCSAGKQELWQIDIPVWAKCFGMFGNHGFEGPVEFLDQTIHFWVVCSCLNPHEITHVCHQFRE